MRIVESRDQEDVWLHELCEESEVVRPQVASSAILRPSDVQHFCDVPSLRLLIWWWFPDVPASNCGTGDDFGSWWRLMMELLAWRGGASGFRHGLRSEWVCVCHPLHFPPLDDSIAPHDRRQWHGLIFLLVLVLVPDDFRSFQVCHSINPNIPDFPERWKTSATKVWKYQPKMLKVPLKTKRKSGCVQQAYRCFPFL